MPPSDAGAMNGAILRLVWRHINRTISPSFSTTTQETLVADGRRLFNHDFGPQAWVPWRKWGKYNVKRTPFSPATPILSFPNKTLQ